MRAIGMLARRCEAPVPCLPCRGWRDAVERVLDPRPRPRPADDPRRLRHEAGRLLAARQVVEGVGDESVAPGLARCRRAGWGELGKQHRRDDEVGAIPRATTGRPADRSPARPATSCGRRRCPAATPAVAHGADARHRRARPRGSAATTRAGGCREARPSRAPRRGPAARRRAQPRPGSPGNARGGDATPAVAAGSARRSPPARPPRRTCARPGPLAASPRSAPRGSCGLDTTPRRRHGRGGARRARIRRTAHRRRSMDHGHAGKDHVEEGRQETARLPMPDRRSFKPARGWRRPGSVPP